MYDIVKLSMEIKREVTSLPTYPRDAFGVQVIMDLMELVDTLRPVFRRQNHEEFGRGAAGEFMASSRFHDSAICADRALGTIWHAYGFFNVYVAKEQIRAVERQVW